MTQKLAQDVYLVSDSTMFRKKQTNCRAFSLKCYSMPGNIRLGLSGSNANINISNTELLGPSKDLEAKVTLFRVP